MILYLKLINFKNYLKYKIEWSNLNFYIKNNITGHKCDFCNIRLKNSKEKYDHISNQHGGIID